MEVRGVEETVRRISSFPGVAGIIVTTRDGLPTFFNLLGTIVRTTMDNASTHQYVNSMRPLEERCFSAVRDIDPTNDLQYLRIRSKRFEIMLKTDGDYALYLIQNPEELTHR